MLLMLLLSSSSRIFALRSFSSALRFLLVICFPSYYNKVVSTPTFDRDKNDLEGEGA